MTHIITKPVPIRLEEGTYRELRKQILRRDRWRCQFCGRMSNLEVHHKAFRSHRGDDLEENLIIVVQCMSLIGTRSFQRLIELLAEREGFYYRHYLQVTMKPTFK